jgi:hypothetical protein
VKHVKIELVDRWRIELVDMWRVAGPLPPRETA